MVKGADEDDITRLEVFVLSALFQEMRVHARVIVTRTLWKFRLLFDLHFEALARRLAMQSIRQRRDRTHVRSAALQRVALYGDRLAAGDFVCIKSRVLSYHNTKERFF